jgi:hypothetical protein
VVKLLPTTVWLLRSPVQARVTGHWLAMQSMHSRHYKAHTNLSPTSGGLRLVKMVTAAL